LRAGAARGRFDGTRRVTSSPVPDSAPRVTVHHDEASTHVPRERAAQ
jgi:hypothetical protein